MNWLYKLERKFGHIYIPNLIKIIMIGQAAIYFLDLLAPVTQLQSRLFLYWPYVMQGQVWRLITFIFVPEAGSPLSLLITVYLYYLIGTTLAREWGDFQFNVYYLIGVLGAIASAAITGYGTTYYINLSMYFAFAILYPNYELLVFFVLPVKMKYLAWFSGALCLINFIFNSSVRVSILFSLLNFLLFFGGDFWKTIKREWGYRKTRTQWRNNNRDSWR